MSDETETRLHGKVKMQSLIGFHTFAHCAAGSETLTE